jgi:hypothetical protein
MESDEPPAQGCTQGKTPASIWAMILPVISA